MKKEDLLQKELSNLYAINKQINNYFNGSEISFLTEKNQLNLMEYVKLVCQNEDQISDALNNLDYNPTNTTDSIVNEITENLSIIANQDISNEVKELGYLMSINRLVGYQMANIENVQFISSAENKKVEFSGINDDFNGIKNKFITTN